MTWQIQRTICYIVHYIVYLLWYLLLFASKVEREREREEANRSVSSRISSINYTILELEMHIYIVCYIPGAGDECAQNM